MQTKLAEKKDTETTIKERRRSAGMRHQGRFILPFVLLCGAALSLLLASAPVFGQATAIRLLPGFMTTTFGPNDDGSYPCVGPESAAPPNCDPTPVPIGFAVNFYGQTFTNLFVNNNGNITFDAPLSEYSPFGFMGVTNQIISPYFADVDTRVGHLVTFGNDTVDGRAAFGVNWISVGYFDQNTNKVDSFQLILIERSDRNLGDFDIEFNYDSIQWESGDASGGTEGLGGDSAVAGFSNGSGLPGSYFQLAGSGINGEFLDGNPGGLTHSDLNTNVVGRYVFPIVNLNTVLNVPPLSQDDSRWAADAYDNSPTHAIQDKGSALVCLSMALNYAGITNDPGTLNNLLTVDNDYVGSGINWDPATRDASGNKLEFHAYRTSDINYLSQALGNGFPVIVGVNLNAGGAPSHFVLVIGEQDGDFIVNDPGQAGATNLADFGNAFETRGYVGDPIGDVSGLDVAVNGAADLLLFDPFGRRTGFSPIAGGTLEEIPQSVHFLDCLEDSDMTGLPGTDTAHSVVIFQPPQGTYQLYLIGSNSVNYALAVRSFSASGTPETPTNLQGTINLEQLIGYQLNFGVSGAALGASLTPTNFVSLYSFTGGEGGGFPNPQITQGLDGDLYGTTLFGGSNSAGTVYKITPGGAFTTLYTFGTKTDTNGNFVDGDTPNGGLLLASNDLLYGTTEFGGVYDGGTIYSITSQGALSVLYSFGAITDTNGDLVDGDFPSPALVQGSDGNLYGTTEYGGTNDAGIVFKITTNGSLTVLHVFGSVTDTNGNSADGQLPGSLVLGADGNFYGTTESGGPYTDIYGTGYGTVYRITPAGALTTLHPFGAAANGVGGAPVDGASPGAGLVLARDASLYGTTQFGGTNGTGTIFKIDAKGVFSSLYSFGGFADGSTPAGPLMQGLDGDLYGTTTNGGALNGGTIFRFNEDDTVTTLYSFFGAADGAYPQDGLMQAADGNLYGTASQGGVNDQGAIFRVNIGSSAITPTVRIQSVSVSNGTVTFVWGAVPGKSYQVQYTGAVPAAVWQNLGAPVAATGSTLSASDQIGANQQRFYRDAAASVGRCHSF